MLPYVFVARVESENQRASAFLKLLLSRLGNGVQGFWPSTKNSEPEVKQAGQAMHFPLVSGTRLVVGCRSQ